jgi:hypothetical protein
MLDLCRRATDRRDKIRVWFAPPGWVPANLRPSDPSPRYDPKVMVLYDPAHGDERRQGGDRHL